MFFVVRRTTLSGVESDQYRVCPAADPEPGHGWAIREALPQCGASGRAEPMETQTHCNSHTTTEKHRTTWFLTDSANTKGNNTCQKRNTKMSKTKHSETKHLFAEPLGPTWICSHCHPEARRRGSDSCTRPRVQAIVRPIERPIWKAHNSHSFLGHTTAPMGGSVLHVAHCARTGRRTGRAEPPPRRVSRVCL